MARKRSASKDIITIQKSDHIMFRLEPSLKGKVEEHARRNGMSAAAVIRMAVRAFIEPRPGR